MSFIIVIIVIIIIIYLFSFLISSSIFFRHKTTYDFASYHDDGDKYTLHKVDTFVVGYPNSRYSHFLKKKTPLLPPFNFPSPPPLFFSPPHFRGYLSLKFAEVGSLPCYLTNQESHHSCQPGKTFGCNENGTMWVSHVWIFFFFLSFLFLFFALH